MTRTPGLKRDEDGVSAVIGAILVVGLIVATTITVQTQYVPVWSEQREYGHVQTLQNQLATLKDELDRQVQNRTSFAKTTSVTMGVPAGGSFNGQSIPDKFAFDPTPKTATWGTNAITLFGQDGRLTDAVNENWATVQTGTEVTNVFSVHSLRVKLLDVSNTDNGDHVTVTVYGGDGLFAGDFRMLVDNADQQNNDYAIYHRTRTASSTVISDNPHQYSGPRAPIWVDLLLPEERFQQILAAAAPPMRLVLTQTEAAEFAVTYTIVSEGEEIIVGGGAVTNQFAKSSQSGSLVYHNFNEHYVAQEYHFEHGGLILKEGDQALFHLRPLFNVGRVVDVTSVVMVLPGLVGNAATLAGESNAAVVTRPGLQRAYLGQAPMLGVTLQTSFPAVWATFWADVLADVPGFVPGVHYTISTTSTTASLTIYGTDADAGSFANDVFLDVRQSDIQVELKV